MTGWRAAALARLEPTPDEDATVHEDAQALLQDVEDALAEHGWEGHPRIEGSLAKGTYLHGEADADVFVQFPTSVPRDELDRRVRLLKDLLEDPVVAYAEHPYAEGSYRGRDAEIVPCYAIDDPSELRSAVDRTPFHTEHVKAKLTDELRAEVRLLKAFLQAAECYGAEEATRGVSGYLCELLVLAHGSFDAVLSWAVDGCPHPVTFDDAPEGDFEAPLLVVDPVDPTRNAAAAVAKATLVRLREAAAAFRAEPRERFFAAPPAPELGSQEALAVVEHRRSRVLALAVPVEHAELTDPLYAQLRRAVTLAAAELEREQVPVLATAVALSPAGSPERGWALVEASADALEQPYLHEGPPSSAKPHADQFRDAWADDPRAVGDVFDADGRLYVRVERDEDTLAAIVEPHLDDANAGKVVDEALSEDAGTLVEGKQAILEVPPSTLGELLDRRRPWERWPPQ